METGLDGKRVVITGSARGIGKAIACAFADEGAHLFLIDKEPDTLQRTVRELSKQTTVGFTIADLSRDGEPERAIDEATTSLGGIDVLVNNVGTYTYRDSFEQVSMDDWRSLMDINFFSMVRCCRAVLPLMKKQGSGVILSTGSDCARQPDSFLVDYSATKAAMLSLTKALANEYGPLGIRVNMVSPAAVRTEKWDEPGGWAEKLAHEYGLEKEEAIVHFAREVRQMPVGRVGLPHEIAPAYVFLASKQASFVTGSEYTVNGGILKAI